MSVENGENGEKGRIGRGKISNRSALDAERFRKYSPFAATAQWENSDLGDREIRWPRKDNFSEGIHQRIV